MTYGLMTAHDYTVLDQVLQDVLSIEPSETIRTLEIGVHNGKGSRGIRDFFLAAGRKHIHTGIDNRRDFFVASPFPECNFIVGDSIAVYNRVADDSQDFILIDGCHNYPMTMADFLVYQQKVKIGGFMAFHDTSPLIPDFKDYQGMGDPDDREMYIDCRHALNTLGLLSNTYTGWRLVRDEHDEFSDTGGLVVITKIWY